MAKVGTAELPLDANKNPMQITPPRPALDETYDATVSASTELTLEAGTTFVEVSAIDAGIFMKYGTSDVTNADFDEFIGPNATRHYVIPLDPTTSTKYTALNFIEEVATPAKLVVIEK